MYCYVVTLGHHNTKFYYIKFFSYEVKKSFARQNLVYTHWPYLNKLKIVTSTAQKLFFLLPVSLYRKALFFGVAAAIEHEKLLKNKKYIRPKNRIT